MNPKDSFSLEVLVITLKATSGPAINVIKICITTATNESAGSLVDLDQ